MPTPQDEFGIDWDKEAERCAAVVKEGYPDCSIFGYFKEFIKPDMSVLEVGCNIANWYPTWRSLEPSIKYTGIDFSETGLRIARERYPVASFVFSNAKEMIFDQQFDVVFTHTMLQHVSIETKKILAPRIWGALKPDGFLIIQENTATVSDGTWPNREGWINFFEGYGFKLIKAHDIGGGGTGFVFQKV